jgi:hypothetical protein
LSISKEDRRFGFVSGPYATDSAPLLTILHSTIIRLPRGRKEKPGITVVMEGYGGAGGPYSVTSNDCDGSLKPGGTCTLGIMFAPSEPGAQNATLTIIDNAEHDPQSVKLTGKGKVPKK